MIKKIHLYIGEGKIQFKIGNSVLVSKVIDELLKQEAEKKS